MVTHVCSIPLDDIDDHINEYYCKCKPNTIMIEGIIVTTHNSFDGREVVEEFNNVAGLSQEDNKTWGIFKIDKSEDLN